MSYVVIVTPVDPEHENSRGTEVFGPFETREERNAWADAAEESDVFLDTNFLLTQLEQPLTLDQLRTLKQF